MTGNDEVRLGPTPRAITSPTPRFEKKRIAPDLRPTHLPLRFAESPPGWMTCVLTHTRNEPQKS
jgi:hypothetical protein